MTIYSSSGLQNNLADMDQTQLAREVEGMFFKSLVKEMSRNLPKDGLLSGGFSGQFFSDMFYDTLAGEAAQSANLGLAERLTARSPAEPQKIQIQEGITLPVAGRISSDYGPRRDPFTGENRFHHGIDIAAPKGSPIASMSDGTVIHAGPMGNYGQTVRLRRENGSEITYAHCDRVLVSPGQKVKNGTILGEVGQTGRATGPHLHLEIRHGGRSVAPETWNKLLLDKNP